jgi:hypothetical protein
MATMPISPEERADKVETYARRGAVASVLFEVVRVLEDRLGIEDVPGEGAILDITEGNLLNELWPTDEETEGREFQFATIRQHLIEARLFAELAGHVEDLQELSDTQRRYALEKAEELAGPNGPEIARAFREES